MWIFLLLLPIFIFAALGSSPFFAQHEFERMPILLAEAWMFYRAALASSRHIRHR